MKYFIFRAFQAKFADCNLDKKELLRELLHIQSFPKAPHRVVHQHVWCNDLSIKNADSRKYAEQRSCSAYSRENAEQTSVQHICANQHSYGQLAISCTKMLMNNPGEGLLGPSMVKNWSFKMACRNRPPKGY